MDKAPREVVEILKSRKLKGVPQFKVVFKGTDPAKSKWVNESELNCPTMILAFKAAMFVAKPIKSKASTKAKLVEIKGAKMIDGVLNYQIVMTDSPNPVMVPCEKMRTMFPSALIDYLQGLIVLTPPKTD